MSKQDKFPKYDLLGVDVDAITIDEAAKHFSAHAADPKSPPMTAVKLYVELLDRAYQDSGIRGLLNEFDFELPEGVSVQWAAAYLSGRHSLGRAVSLAASIIFRPSAIRAPIAEKFGGTVFTWRLLEECAAKKASVYMIGSPKNGDIRKSAEYIKSKLPKLEISGTWPGELDGLSGKRLANVLDGQPIEADLVKDLKAKRPDVVLVAMGFPLQERIIAKIVLQLDHGVFIGEGGTFDYDSFGGPMAKAPRFVQKIGLEWLWRLILEPSRIKRQWVIPRLMWRIYRLSK